MIKLDGTTYDVMITAYDLTADFLDKYAERDTAGVLHREILGVYFNQSFTFGRGKNTGDYKLLFDKLSSPVEYHDVECYTPMGKYTFKAYISGVSSKALKIYPDDDTSWWSSTTAKFTAQSPTRTR